MKVTLNINDKDIFFRRSMMTGNFVYVVDGKETLIQDEVHFSTHFDVQLSRTYKVEVDESTVVKIVKTRPQIMAGFRKQNYKFYVNDSLVEEVDSY